MQVHTTNVYDNLPDEEVVRRDGRLYFVQVRAYVPMADVVRLSARFDIPADKLRATVIFRLLEGGTDFLGDPSRGVAFWMKLWKAIRLEERLVLVEDLPDFPFPEGLDATKVEDILKDAPSDFRFHLEFRSARKLPEHASAAASARLSAGAGYFRDRFRISTAWAFTVPENWMGRC